MKPNRALPDAGHQMNPDACLARQYYMFTVPLPSLVNNEIKNIFKTKIFVLAFYGFIISLFYYNFHDEFLIKLL